MRLTTGLATSVECTWQPDDMPLAHVCCIQSQQLGMWLIHMRCCRYIAAQMDRSVRFVGLSTALANAQDLADWLGIGQMGLFNFKPSVRPVPLECHIQGFPGGCTADLVPSGIAVCRARLVCGYV